MNAYRKLLPIETQRYRDHLLRLDRTDRHMRFAGTVSDGVIEQHCLRLDWSTSTIIGYFDGNEMRAAVEIRTPEGLLPKHAELAFSVERACQGQGVGSALMRRALTVACNRGIRRLDVICLRENRAMQALARKFARTVVVDGCEVNVTIEPHMPNHISFMLEVFDDGAALMSSWFDSFTGATARVAH